MGNENELIPEEEKVFTDRNGNVWDTTLSLAGAYRIDARNYEEIGGKNFSILTPHETFFADVLKCPPVLWAMLFQVVLPQIPRKLKFPEGHSLEGKPVDPEKHPIEAEVLFADGLLGDSMDNAREAFWKSIADFFPKSKTALLTLVRLTQKANAKVGKNLQTMEPKLERILDANIDKETKKVEAELEKMLREAEAETTSV